MFHSPRLTNTAMYPGMRKRKQEADGSSEPAGRSPLSPILRAPAREAARPAGAVSNRYYKDNCASLFRQHVEELDEEHAEFSEANPNSDYYWQACEYIREINQFKDLYQKPFTGFVLTCGSNEMNVLGYEHDDNVTRPKRVKTLTVGIVQIACGSAHTVVLDANGRVYAFGSSDEGAMGRAGEDYTGDLQVTGFNPSKQAKFPTPVANEDDCIIKVVCGTIQTLCLSIHGNLYEMGCFRDYDDKKLRDLKPPDDTTVDPQGKKFPFGALWRPTHLWQIPGKVKDMASGTHMNVAILEDGTVVTWGVGTRGELARPVPAQFSDKETEFYHVDLLRDLFLKPLPVFFPIKLDVINVACGVGHLMVVAREPGAIESTVYASGLNGDGQLGLGDRVDRKVLTPLHYTKTMMIAHVEAGSYHTLALDLSKTRLFGCGQCDSGQLGHTDKDVGKEESKRSVTKLQPVPFPEEDLEIEQIACGEYHNLAIVKPSQGKREVYTWGFGDPSGALGHGKEENEWRPKKISLPRKKSGQAVDGVWRGVSGGAQHSAFLFSPTEN